MNNTDSISTKALIFAFFPAIGAAVYIFAATGSSFLSIHLPFTIKYAIYTYAAVTFLCSLINLKLYGKKAFFLNLVLIPFGAFGLYLLTAVIFFVGFIVVMGTH